MLTNKLPLILLSLSLVACAGNPEPPQAPPQFTDAPAIEDGWHATYQTTKVFDAPLEPLLAWIDEGGHIVGAMEETDRIKKPVEVEVVKGDWPEAGSARWLKFSDGHYMLEQVRISNLPERFSYQVYGITSDARNHITYAQGEQRWRSLPDGRSELTWTYRLRPNSIIKRPFVQGFLDNDMKPFMDGALDRVAAKAAVEFEGWREDPMLAMN